jgi:hypothetical protein
MTPVHEKANMDHEKLYAARLHATRVRPYLATALFALHPVESARVPTMAVDRHWRCYVSPAFVAATPVHELAGVWVHEVSHLLRDHHGRGDRHAADHGLTGPAERLRMNIAADFEINDDAYGDGLATPSGAAHPAQLNLPAGEHGKRPAALRRGRCRRHCGCGAGTGGPTRRSVATFIAAARMARSGITAWGASSYSPRRRCVISPAPCNARR